MVELGIGVKKTDKNGDPVGRQFNNNPKSDSESKQTLLLKKSPLKFKIMDEACVQALEGKGLYYGPYVKDLIALITRVQGKIDLEAQKVFGKHIHAFSWALLN